MTARACSYGGNALEVVASITLTSVQYVSTAGNDANDGNTWATAKATVQAAVGALPLAADGIARNGTVEIGYGTFTGASYARTDAGCTGVSTSATINDTSCLSTDVGMHIFQGGNIKANAVVQSVVQGTSFNSTVNPGATINESITFVRPMIDLPPGVTLRGRGRVNGYLSGPSTNYPTQILDTGTGVTIWGPAGSGPSNVTGNESTVRCVVRDLVCIGNSGNISGFYGVNCWGIEISGCAFAYHGQWGIYLDSNAPLPGEVTNTTCQYNGSTSATTATGGIYLATTPNIFKVTNSRFNINNGLNAKVGAGIHLDGCDFTSSVASSYSVNNVGTGVQVECFGSVGNGSTTFTDCWIESAGVGTPCHVSNNGTTALTFIGCTFKSDSSNVAYAIYGSGGPLTLIGCNCAGTFNTGIIYINSSLGSGPVWWQGITVNAVSGSRGFLYDSNSGVVMPVSVAVGGSHNVAPITSPPAPTLFTLASGTPLQNPTGYDAMMYVQWAAAANGDSMTFALGPKTTGAQSLGTITRRAGDTEISAVHVPANWYLTATIGGTATLTGNSVAQPV